MNDPERLARVLEGARAVGLASHVNPDGDSVGALLALTMALEGEGKKAYASLPDPAGFPPQYLFLPGRDRLGFPGGFPDDLDVFVALDCSNRERLDSLQEAALAAPLLINIDHHEDNTYYGTHNLVDVKASSTSEMVFELMGEAGWRMTPEIATCLYTGVVTDTGRFRHRSTSPRTFMVASRLAEAGADIHRVVEQVYENQSPAYVRLVGRVLQRMRILEDLGLAYGSVTRTDLAETGATLPETEDLIDHLRSVRGTRLAALFKELEDGKVRVSLRSRAGFEAGPIARAMGGGGHAMAAGYTSDLDLEGSIRELLEALGDAR